MERVAITGIGLVSPVGLDTETSWRNLLDGRSGIAEIEAFDPGEMPVRVAGEVRGFDPAGLVPAKETRRMDRNVLLALAAAKEAADDAGAPIDDPSRAGVVVGSAIGGFDMILEQHRILQDRGWERVSPHFLPSTLVD